MLLWIIIFLELISFGIALVAMVYNAQQEPEIFPNSCLLLNPVYGVINTIFLLTSGFLMAVTVQEYKIGSLQKFRKFLTGAMIFGMLF